MQQGKDILVKRDDDFLVAQGEFTEEELIKMYEEYMDEEEIQAIIDLDSEEETQITSASNKHKRYNYNDPMIIPINDFVTNYLWLGYTPAKEEDVKERKRVEREDRRVNKDYNKTTKQYKIIKNEIAQASDDQVEDVIREKAIKNENIRAASTSTERVNIKFQPGRSYTLGIDNYSTLYHSGLKDIGSPYLFVVGNEYADHNEDKVAHGDIIRVIDARKSVRVYINTYLIEQLLHDDEIQLELKVVKAKLYHGGCKSFTEFQQCYNEEKILSKQVKENEKTRKLLIETHKDKNFRRLKEGMKRA